MREEGEISEIPGYHSYVFFSFLLVAKRINLPFDQSILHHIISYVAFDFWIPKELMRPKRKQRHSLMILL